MCRIQFAPSVALFLHQVGLVLKAAAPCSPCLPVPATPQLSSSPAHPSSSAACTDHHQLTQREKEGRQRRRWRRLCSLQIYFRLQPSSVQVIVSSVLSLQFSFSFLFHCPLGTSFCLHYSIRTGALVHTFLLLLMGSACLLLCQFHAHRLLLQVQSELHGLCFSNSIPRNSSATV